MKTAYPQIKGTCSIRLYSNIPFDNTYEHHSLISEVFKYNGTQLYSGTSSNGLAKERFINRLKAGTTERYYPRYDLVGDFNFNFSNGLIASVTLELTPAQTNANYLRLTCGDDIYYYFITGISQNNFDTYTLSLELDVLMTYQDEFLEGMKDVPVFTNRKHCHRYTNDGLYPKCADFKHGESAYMGIKPSIIRKKEQLNINMSGATGINNIKWLYVCVDGDFTWEGNNPPSQQDYEEWDNVRYRYKEVRFPLMMLCVPVNVTELVITNNDDIERTIDGETMQMFLNSLVSSGKIHGAKVSPYPPFILKSGETAVYSQSGVLTITTDNLTRSDTPFFNDVRWENEKSRLHFRVGRGYIILSREVDKDFPLTNSQLDIANVSEPTILKNRYDEPKLLFSPFKKYVLGSTYSSGNEFYPELIYSDGVYTSNVFKFKSIYNYYIGDYSIFTYQESLEDDNGNKFYEHYKANNIGLSASINYIVPSGTNALAVFNATQSQSYYQSKIASGITSGLSVAGGVASIVLGAGMTASSGGGLTPMGLGLVSSGVTAIAGGTAGLVNNIKSYNAKIEDLKNTPDAINVQGGSFVGDYSRNNTLPFIVVYDVADATKKQANDYFYNYGYEVARDCYFNDELEYDNDVSNVTDDNLFGRTIFNYIKLNEDITNKINADIPHIVKQKLSSLFNNGITLWSFIRFGSLWTSTEYETGTYNVDKWFMKHNLDNTEYKVS